MASILREISVDVAQLNRFQAIVAKQYDKQSRYLKVHLTNMGEEIYIDSSATVVINARREDDNGMSFSGTVNGDGSVTVPLTQWMLALDGTVKCDISIIVGTEQMLTSTLFELQVEEAAVNEESMEDDENYGVLIDLIEEVEDVKTEYETSATNMKNAYEASMTQALSDVQTAISAAQLVSGPFYIVNNDNHKTYQAALQVTNGKPRLVYDEFVGT